MRYIRYFALFVIISAVLSCVTTDTGWKQARIDDSIQSYQIYLKNNANGKHADIAKQRIQLLEKDKADWEEAKSLNNIESYRQFIDEHEDSPYTDKAKARIVDLEVDGILNKPHGELPESNKIQSSEKRTFSVVNIHNDTQYHLVIRYSGKDSCKIDFDPGEKGSIEIVNGDYRVTATVNMPTVRDYAGNEMLDGNNMQSTYYIKSQNDAPRKRKPQDDWGAWSGYDQWPLKRAIPDYYK